MSNAQVSLNPQAAAAPLQPGDPYAPIDARNAEAWALCDQDFARAVTLAEEALALARAVGSRNAGYATGIAEALRTLGYANMRQANYAQAITLLLEALPIARKLANEACLADTLDGIGSVHAQLGQLPEALTYMYEQLEVATRCRDAGRMGNAFNNLAYVHAEEKEYAQAEALLRKTLDLATETGSERLAFLSTVNLAIISQANQQGATALDYAQRGVAMCRAARLDPLEPYALCTVAQANLLLEQPAEAIPVLLEALDLARERNVPSTEGLIQHNLGEVYMALGNPQAAIEHLLLCAARKQALNERSELARCHLYLSEAHEQAGNPAKALEHFRIHHTLHEQVAGERADMRLKVLHVTHETNAALHRAREAALRADDLAREVLGRTTELQSTVAQLQSEMDQRTRIQKELHRTLASLEHRLADRTEELAAFFDLTLLGSRGVDLADVLELILPRILEVTRSRAVCIHQLDAESACLRLVGEQNVPQNLRGQMLEISLQPDFLEWLQQPNDPVASTSLPALTTIPSPLRLPGYATYLGVQVRSGAQPLGILSCYRFTNRGFGVDEIALVAALAEQTSLLFETNRLRGEVQAKAVLEERHRLARDLHDSVTQSLYSLSLLSRAAREALRAGDTQHLDDCLTELERDTLHALREMRLLLYELRPANLESAGLVAALEFRLDTVERRAGLQIELDLDEFVGLSPALEVEVYYIVVEALNNVVKHAAANRVQLRLANSATTVQIRIADDGIGYDHRHPGRGLGLRSIRERVARLNGRLTITSEPARGTVVEAECPYAQEASV